MKNLAKSVSKNKLNLNSNYEGFSLNAFNKDKRVINFSPGPGQIPIEVLDKIYDKSVYGVTPYEISHRSPEFNNILDRVNKNMKTFLEIPDDFTILWTQGGGHGQFAAIPLNFKNIMRYNKANYIVTGTWSDRAFKESLKFINSYNSLNLKEDPIKIKNIDNPIFNINENDKYVYLCSNETVNGIEFRNSGIPYPDKSQLKNSKLIIDMSSDMSMKKINWENIDMAFACTSKNFGVAGANVVIIKKSLLNELNTIDEIPSILDWNIYDKSNSLYNTPAIFNIFLIDKILEYYINLGGIEVLENNSITKGNLVYNFLDSSNIFKPVINNKKIRSNINIPFIIEDEQLRSIFLDYCFKNNIVGLRTKTPFSYKDYQMIEPLRISLYNGISLEETKILINIMKTFESMLTGNIFIK